MNSSLINLFLRSIRITWTIIEDFTLKQTIEELAFLINDIRSGVFDVPNLEMKRKLEAALSATQNSYALLVQSKASEDSIKVLKQKVTLLQDLLQPKIQPRDILAGSLSKEEELGKEWQRVAEHSTTADFIIERSRNVARHVFEDRDLREETIRLQTQLKTQMQLLTEIRDLLKPEAIKQVQGKLDALEFAAKVIKTKKSSGTKKDASQTTSVKKEIPIE